MSEDPSVKLEIDSRAFDYMADQVDQLADTIEQDEEAKAQVAKQEQTTEEQALAQQDDPRNAEKWGFKALVKEGQSIVSGGLQDTASSVATFAERTKEALDGTMQRERKSKVITDLTGILLQTMIILSKPRHGGVDSYVDWYISVH